jgi:hypothetical protein
MLLGVTAALALWLDSPSAPEELQAIRTPFVQAVRNVVGNLDSVLLSIELCLKTPEEMPLCRDSRALDEQIGSSRVMADWFRFLATDAFKAEVRRHAPERAERYAELIDRMVVWCDASTRQLEDWRALVADAERFAPELGTTVDEILDNPLVQFFESLPEERKRRYDQLAEAGQRYDGDAEAEQHAFDDGSHPLLAR